MSMDSEERGTYTLFGIRCGNCKAEPWEFPDGVTIPRGRPLAEEPCPKCGCKTLRKGI